jgi:hypothetical protein
LAKYKAGYSKRGRTRERMAAYVSAQQNLERTSDVGAFRRTANTSEARWLALRLSSCPKAAAKIDGVAHISTRRIFSALIPCRGNPLNCCASAVACAAKAGSIPSSLHSFFAGVNVEVGALILSKIANETDAVEEAW